MREGAYFFLLLQQASVTNKVRPMKPAFQVAIGVTRLINRVTEQVGRTMSLIEFIHPRFTHIDSSVKMPQTERAAKVSVSNSANDTASLFRL